MTEQKKKPTSSFATKWVKRLWMLFIFGLLGVVLLMASIRFGMWGEMPDLKDIENPETKLATEVYAQDGDLLGKMFYQEDRTNITAENIPDHLKNALVATEDCRFYSHSGIDGKALARAIGKLGRDGGGSTISQQLALNLYQHRADNIVKRVIQKLKEWILAVQLERNYSKDEIITMYFNTVPYGNSHGIKSAAKRYFNSKVEDLKIEEAAVLVGMLKANTYYNPIRNPSNAIRRRNVVLKQMQKYEYITQVQYDSLRQLTMETDYNYIDHNRGLATYFRSYLTKYMKEWTKEYERQTGTKYNIYDDGLKVYTTIDSKMQEYAEKAVGDHMKSLQKQFFKETKRRKRDPWYKEDEQGNAVYDKAYPMRMMKRTVRYRGLKKKYGAGSDSLEYYLNKPVKMKLFTWNGDVDTMLSPMDSLKYYKQILHTGFMSFEPKTGHIKAWVGGINHSHFQYDHVNQKSTRQVGSTFKPLVYARGLDDDKLEPCEVESTAPVRVEFGDNKVWEPQNSGDVPSELTFYEGLQRSVNTMTARVMKRLGPQSADIVKQTASNMGIDASRFVAGPSIALGTMDISVFEMVGAYGTFVNEGTYVEPIFITRIEDKHGNILQEFTPEKKEALRPQTAHVVCKMLEKVTMSPGTGARLRSSRFKIPGGVAMGGKTGTTQGNSDGWFMNITPNLVSGVWVGAEERNVHFKSTRLGQGANMALPIVGKYLEQVYANPKVYKIDRGPFKEPEKGVSIATDCEFYKGAGKAPGTDSTSNKPPIEDPEDIFN